RGGLPLLQLGLRGCGRVETPLQPGEFLLGRGELGLERCRALGGVRARPRGGTRGRPSARLVRGGLGAPALLRVARQALLPRARSGLEDARTALLLCAVRQVVERALQLTALQLGAPLAPRRGDRRLEGGDGGAR